MEYINETVGLVQNAYKQVVSNDEKPSSKELAPFMYAISQGFLRHEQASEIEKAVKAWAKRLDIWSDPDTGSVRDGDMYNTMTAYLHPVSILDTEEKYNQYVWIGKFYAFLYYIDDRFGNDTQCEEDLPLVTAFREGLVGYLSGKKDCMSVIAIADLNQEQKLELTKVFLALKSLLASMRTFNPIWQKFFMKTVKQHLQAATENYESIIAEGKLDIDSYSWTRINVAGMNLSEALMILAEQNFEYLVVRQANDISFRADSLVNFTCHYDGEELSINDIFESIKNFCQKYQSETLSELTTETSILAMLYAVIKNAEIERCITLNQLLDVHRFLTLSVASEWNDVMSVWKELLIEGSLFNIVPVVFLQTGAVGMSTVVKDVSAFLDNKTKLAFLLDAFFNALDESVYTTNNRDGMAVKQTVTTHSQALLNGVRAGRKWQETTGRYNSVLSAIKCQM